MAFEGTWWNQLGSQMDLRRDAAHPRRVSGEYHTNVGNAKHRTYPLVGRADATGQLLAWVVVWDPPDEPTDPEEPPSKPSITAWTGQYQRKPDSGVEFIASTWLLTHPTEPKDDWRSTGVSMDFFFRNKPSPQMVALAKELGKAGSYFTEPIDS